MKVGQYIISVFTKIILTFMSMIVIISYNLMMY